MQDGFDRIKNFWAKPYDEDMDLVGWVLFLGLISLISLGWATVLKKV